MSNFLSIKKRIFLLLFCLISLSLTACNSVATYKHARNYGYAQEQKLKEKEKKAEKEQEAYDTSGQSVSEIAANTTSRFSKKMKEIGWPAIMWVWLICGTVLAALWGTAAIKLKRNIFVLGLLLTFAIIAIIYVTGGAVGLFR